MKPLKSAKPPAVESLAVALAEAGVHVNARDCRPMSREAGKAIGEAARKLRAHYRGKQLAGRGR